MTSGVTTGSLDGTFGQGIVMNVLCKRTVRPKIKILFLFTHPHVVVYDSMSMTNTKEAVGKLL